MTGDRHPGYPGDAGMGSGVVLVAVLVTEPVLVAVLVIAIVKVTVAVLVAAFVAAVVDAQMLSFGGSFVCVLRRICPFLLKT